MSFFVEFERAITLEAPPGVMETFPRDTKGLLKLFEGYSNCKFELFQLDFSEGLPTYASHQATNGGLPSNYGPHQLASMILNFGNRAEILINSMLKANGDYLVNFCHRRFYIIKEAFHVILRDEFIRKGLGHPDTATPEKLQSLIESLVYLPFSIIDISDPEYPDSERVEHAAELLSLMILYPLDRIARDRNEFREQLGVASFEDMTIMMANTFAYADTAKIPQRYIDLAFRWHKFDELYTTYQRLRSSCE
jgi:hypothetical protein